MSLLVQPDRQQFSVLIIYSYDAPSPSEVFEDFLAIPAITGDVYTRSFSDLVHIQAPQAQFDDLRLVVLSAVWLNIG
jgi:hypothetical protein